MSMTPNHDDEPQLGDDDPELLAALSAAFGDECVDLQDINFDDLDGESNDDLREDSAANEPLRAASADPPPVPSSTPFDSSDPMLLEDSSTDIAPHSSDVDDGSLAALISKLDAAMAAIQTEFEPADVAEIATDRPADEARFVVFQCGEQLAALPLAEIREIDRLPGHTVLPRMPHWCLGIANIRGEIVSITDLAALVGGQSATPNTIPSARKVILTHSPKSDATTALVVDRVVGLRSFGGTITKRPDDLRLPLSQVAGRVATLHEKLVLLIDPDQLFDHPEMRVFLTKD